MLFKIASLLPESMNDGVLDGFFLHSLSFEFCFVCLFQPLSLMYNFLKCWLVLGPLLILEDDDHKLAGGPVPVKRL